MKTTFKYSYIQLLNRYLFSGLILFAFSVGSSFASESMAENLAAQNLLTDETDIADEGLSVESVQKELGQAYDTIKVVTIDRKERAAEQIDIALVKLDRRIEALENALDRKYHSMDKAARIQARITLQKLRKSRAKMSEWVGAMKHSSTSAWDSVKEGAANSWNSLSEAWGDAESDVE